MTFLPIVDRELRVASRRRATYWMRAVAALGAIVIGAFMYVVNRQGAPHEFGKNLFAVLSTLSISYCLISGVRSTADCLSEEKREGTFGLLFLTDLKGYDVVFGKLVATSLGAFYGLLAIFPVLAVPLLMGGITNGEFWRMALVLVNTFLFSLAIGIFISSCSKSARKAMAGTFILILLFTAVLPACADWIPYLARSPKLGWALWLPCPFSSFSRSFDVQYKSAADYFWWSTGIIHALTWLFLLLASFIAPRSWQDKPAGASLARWRGLWHRWSYGDAADRNAFRKRLLDVNAFYWLAGRARFKPTHVWAFLGLIACFWAWGCIEVGTEWFNEGTYIITAIVLNSALKLWVASEAGRRLGEDRKMGSLELLLSTPFGVRDILHGQLLALRRQFLGPIILVAIIEFTFMVASLQKESFQGDPAYLMFWVAYMVMLVADVIALSWVGMWVALTARNPNRATGITVVRVLVLPWVLFTAILVVVSCVAFATSVDVGAKFYLGLWFGLGVLADLAFGLNARWQLLTNFRLVAMQRFTPGKSRFARWFGRGSAPVPNPPPVVAV
ncbi:MAG: hypothetical protein JWR69_761 [Pedosphaera sp.]|nr:hypothetical protein [Pedosphaera sp.]